MNSTSHHFNNELFCYFVSNLKNKIKIVNFASKKINKDEKNLKINFSIKIFVKKKIINFFSSVFAILKKKDEIFITQSVNGIIPVIKINKTKIGNGRVGKRTNEIMELYKAACISNNS